MAALKQQHGDETLLLVEDQQEVLQYAAPILTSYGYHVLEASDGAEASAIAQEYSEDIHLLLTDVILPGITGKDLVDRIRLSRPKLKVVLMSGYPADVIARRGVLEQDVSYLPKPFSPESLAEKVRQVLSEPGNSRSAALPSQNEAVKSRLKCCAAMEWDATREPAQQSTGRIQGQGRSSAAALAPAH